MNCENSGHIGKDSNWMGMPQLTRKGEEMGNNISCPMLYAFFPKFTLSGREDI